MYINLPTTLIFALLNLGLQIYYSNTLKTQTPITDNQTLVHMYDQLKVEKNHKRRYKNRILNLQNQRKKREFQTNSSEPDSEDEIPVSAYLHKDQSQKFNLTGNIGSSNICFEIDTGSATSIISKDSFNKIDKAAILSERPPQREYTDFSGNSIEFEKEVELQIQFGETLITHFFLVTKRVKATNLLGIDIIRGKQMNIQFDNKYQVFITFNTSDNNVKQKLLLNENISYPLYATSTTDIERNSSNLISASFYPSTINLINSKTISEMVGITKFDFEHLPYDEMITCIDHQGLIDIPIANKSNSNTIISEGQQIGTFSLLPKHTELYNHQNKIYEIIGDNHKVTPNINNIIKNAELELNSENTKQVNKIKLSNNSDSESAVANESDLGEDLLHKIRIPEPDTVWKDVLENVPPHLQKKVFHLLTEKYKDVVAKHSLDFGCCTLVDSEFSINLDEKTPLFVKPYPLNRVYQEQLDSIIDEMVENNLLLAESSNYSAGIFIRPRPDSTNTGNHRIRVISDYRNLNSKTIRDLFPMPNINMILQKLNKKKFYILLDLKGKIT